MKIGLLNIIKLDCIRFRDSGNLRNMFKRTILLLGLSSLASCLPDPPSSSSNGPLNRSIHTGTGSFIFTPSGSFHNRPLTVYYHIPDSAHESSPIAFIIHGNARDGEYLRDALKAESNRRNTVVIVPNFGSSEYPNNYFLLGNIFDDGENPSVSSRNDSTQWTYQVIEELFNQFQNEISSKDARYDLIGFSAGGQFAHRFAFFSHYPQCDRIVAASSGWYTLPTSDINFPYGLGITERSNPEDIRKALSFPLHIAVGSADTDPNSSGLRHTTEADIQGINRVQRANFAYQLALDQSIALGTTCNWSIHLETGVSHSAQAMGIYALSYLYP